MLSPASLMLHPPSWEGPCSSQMTQACVNRTACQVQVSLTLSSMWPVEENMQEVQALSVRETLRICWSLSRGNAANDPGMALAAVELAESYERQSRFYVWVMRWMPLFMVVVLGYVTASHLADGDQTLLLPYALIVAIAFGTLPFNPLAWPKNMAKARDASRKKARLAKRGIQAR